MRKVYYNEFDPYAAEWLRNLQRAGHIATGDIDDRSISDVHPIDLIGYDQCHFFAGIGVWSYALRLAGWPDDRPVWTGSCPCQPFSAAGKQQGTSDERHLWPAWFSLIEKCKPAVVFGEQVEAAIRHGWLDLVQTDLEGIGYAVAAAGIPAAGFGAPHIRQRLWFVAEGMDDTQRHGRHPSRNDDAEHDGKQPHAAEHTGVMGRPGSEGLEGLGSGHQAESGRDGAVRPASSSSESGGVANTASEQCNAGRIGTTSNEPGTVERSARLCAAGEERPGPTNGHWRDADWLHCRDGKWRPVEASPQPMVDGSAERLGRVRPEIVSKIEEEINAAAMENKVSAAEAVRALRDYLAATAGRQWQAGRVPGLHEAPFLLSFLRELTQQGWQFSQSLSLPSPQTAERELRMLRIAEAAASPSHQRELAGQQPCQFADTVHLLSSILARHAQAAWGHAYETYAEIGFPLGRNAPARVGRLRAYGNAIVPQVAAEVIAAFMECRP